MAQPRSSARFLIGLIAMCSVWLTYPFWRHTPKNEPAPAETSPLPEGNAPRSAFRYSRPAASNRQAGPDYVKPQAENHAAILRQLNRLARMERDGVPDRIIDNPEMPEEIRDRFREELGRLRALAISYPEISLQTKETLPDSRRLTEEKTFTPEFTEVVRMLKLSGTWDDLSDRYVQQLEDAARDPDLPESSRPTRQEIERARAESHIPAL